jgi:hypothetical protein
MAAIALLLPATAPAQTSRAGVVTTLQGTATVARTSTPEPRPLKFRDDVFVQDRITTGEESVARILLGGKAVVTIRERSNLTITETATSSTIEMSSGKIALSVDKSRVKPGESVEIKTPNAVAAIRGTIVVAEVDPPSAQSPDVTTRFTLLTGVVDVTRVDRATGKITGAAVVMRPMQALGVTGFAAAPLAAPRSITRAEADTVASGFSVRLPDPSPSANDKLIGDQVKEAGKATAAIVKKTKVTSKDAAGAGSDDGNRSTTSLGSVTPAGSTPIGSTTATVGTTTGTTSSVGTVSTLTSGTIGGTGSLSGSGSTLIGTVDKLPKDKLIKDLTP